MQQPEPVVIHRTSNCIVMTGNQPQSRQQKQRDNMNKGWQAPNDKPYVALGDFQNVISVVEGLKQQIPHSKEMTAETQKMIQKVKRSHNPLFKTGRPDRTLKILAKIPEPQHVVKHQTKHASIGGNFIDLKGIGEVDSTSIMKKMKALEEQFLTSAVNFNDLQHKQLNQKNILLSQQNDSRSASNIEGMMSNQRLITPALRKLMNTKDANLMLKDEIQESQLRLKAAKYGHRLDEIAPAYDHSFYLPDKTLYFDKSNSNVRTSKSFNKNSARDASTAQVNKINPSQYVTKTQNDASVAFMTEPSQNLFNSQNQARDSQQNIQEYIRTRVGFGQGQEGGPQVKGVGNSTFFDTFNNKNNKSFYSQKPNQSKEQSQNQQDSTFFNQAFRTYDGINKLSPKKPKKLNELTTKYRETFMKIDENGQERNGRRQHHSLNPRLPNLNHSSYDSKPARLHQTNGDQDQPAIRFVSMIDSKPVIPAYLNLVPLKQFNKKESEITRIVTKEQAQGNPSDPLDMGKNTQASQFNWGKMLNEDLDDMLKKKIDKLQEDMLQKKLQDQLKKRTTLGFHHQTQASEQVNPIMEIRQNDHSTTANDNSSSPNSNQLSKIQLMLLGKLISFESLDTFNADDLMRKLYNFFFNWQKDIGADEGNGSLTNKNYENDSDGKGGKGNLSDDMEEKRKRLQLKLDQELIEFEERGGFAKVLKDIFNPTDFSSMELDSVFQLKALCKTFYEKKEKLSTNLVQTLDAMSNERPKTLLMKKNNLNLDMKNGNLYDDIEWMRINAEKQRIQQYREIAKECAYFYYKVLKRFVEENSLYEKERAAEKNNNLLDPQIKMKMFQKEKVLKDILSYITDYMRAVIENGNKFTKEHFYMMLKELNPEHIEQQVGKYLKIMIEELELHVQEFEDFLNSLTNEKLADAYFSITERANRDDGNPESITSGRQSSRLQSQKNMSFQGRESIRSQNLKAQHRTIKQEESFAEVQVYESLDPQTDKILQNNLNVHRKTQISQALTPLIKNPQHDVRYEENGSKSSDPQLASLASSSLNTEGNTELKGRKSVRNGKRKEEGQKITKNQEHASANITSIRIAAEKKTIVNSIVSNQVLPDIRDKKSKVASKKESEIENEDLEDTQKNLSPSINSLNIKARKTEILNQNQLLKEFQKSNVLSQNISPSKKNSQLFGVLTPEQTSSKDKPAMSARAFSSFSKTVLHSARNKDADEFKDSEEDKIRNQPQEMHKGAKSPFKSQIRDTSSVSIFNTENQNPQLTHRATIQRSPQMMMNKRGSKFGNLFKLQKKQINDEGIVHVDEGLNYSYEKQQKQQPLKSMDHDPEPDSINDSASIKSSEDSDFLKLEYQALKETYDQMNKQSSARQSINQSVQSSFKKTIQKSVSKKQNETSVNQFVIDEQKEILQQKEKQKRPDSSRYLESKRSPKGLRPRKSNARGYLTNQTSSPRTTMLQKKQKQLTSYDENSFERELIEKLNEESSIHEDSDILSQKFNKSYKSQKSHKSHKSRQMKSQKNLNLQRGKAHMSKRSMKLEQKSYDSSQSCSTCNNRESRNSSLISEEAYNTRKSQGKHRSSPNKSKISQKKRVKGKKTQKKQNQFQNSPIVMPLLQTGMLNPQQMAMFGYPGAGMLGATTQIMNFQNNYSFQSGSMPYFVQQQQYYNMLFQQLQTQQKMFEQQQQFIPHPQMSPQHNATFAQEPFFTSVNPSANPSVAASNTFQNFNQPIPMPANINQTMISPYNSNSQQQQPTSQQSPQVLKVLEKSPRQISNQRSLDSGIAKNNISNNSLDISDQDFVNKHGFTFAKQKSAQEQHSEAKKRLGSPQSNFSRLEMQSTTVTGDFLGPSSFLPTSLPSEAGPNYRRTEVTIQNQVKEANQQYLNKLKDKFQAAALAAHSTLTNLFQSDQTPPTIPREKSVPQVWGPSPNQEQRFNTAFNNFNSQKMRESQSKNHSSTNVPSISLSRFSPRKDLQQSYPQAQLALDDKHSIVNTQVVNKRMSSLPPNSEFGMLNKIKESRQSDQVVLFERQRSPFIRENGKSVDDKKNQEIQNKLRMLNIKLSQGPQQLLTEPNVFSDKKFSISDSVPMSPNGDIKVELPYLDNSSHNNLRYTETEISRHVKQKRSEVFEMNSDKGDKSNKHEFSIVQQRVISIPFAKRKDGRVIEDQSNDSEQIPTLQDSKSASIPFTRKIQQTKDMNTHTLSSPRRSIQHPMLFNSTQNDVSVLDSIRSSTIKTEEQITQSRLPQKKNPTNAHHQNKQAQLNEKALEHQTNVSLNQNTIDSRIIRQTQGHKKRESDADKFTTGMTPQKQKSDTLIQIFEKPKRNEQSQQPFGMREVLEGQRNDQQSSSLADMFRNKLNSKTLQIEQRQANLSQQPKGVENSKMSGENKLLSPRQDKERTKQNILELRKKMMKSTVREKKDNFVNEQTMSKQSSMPVELMQRLAKGQKVQIDQKEMKKLSTKNYENLPEVKKKKEEEKKKQEYKDRQAQVKKFAEEIEKKRKQIFTKKQNIEN